jgi:lysophospholipase L1-like esterase
VSEHKIPDLLPGERQPGGSVDQRLERDVMAFRPTMMTIMLGRNDADYGHYKAGLFRTYAGGYHHLVERLRKALPETQLTLMEPSPFDDVTRPPQFLNGCNHVLVRYGRCVRELTADHGAVVADVNTPVTAALKRAASLNPSLARRIVPDRIHPAPAGHWLIAGALLRAWNAPRLVTAVTLDGTSQRVVLEQNTNVRALCRGDSLSWNQSNRALPLPLDRRDPVRRLALRASDLMETLDQQPLRVLGLPSARYALRIDGERVGSFSREALAQGVNLAVLVTPMTRQAAAVHELTVCHNEIYFLRWREHHHQPPSFLGGYPRGHPVPLQGAPCRHLPAALQALDAMEQDLLEQRAAAPPRLRRYELTPAP